ncbi:tetratricopeptide repeat protein 31 [Nephila pilipes]|uniref:Tetratricopeptide repeat protein 31 n=1 Tax=Nephila pilipes TaxID=299642 RepID=A0A8X6PL50_NEPPI|nr:tetratricopeptide repeat protein 31 [Nephila pilipes]
MEYLGFLRSSVTEREDKINIAEIVLIVVSIFLVASCHTRVKVMPLTRDDALDILGLPTFATVDDILLRYKVLSLMWYPENHLNPEFAIQEFSNVNEAAVKLIFPEKTLPRNLSLPEMYGFFQYIFFGNRDREGECDYASDENSEASATVEDADIEKQETQAEDKASELLLEEEREKTKAEKRKARKKKRKERKKLEKLEKETSIKMVDSSCNTTLTGTSTRSSIAAPSSKETSIKMVDSSCNTMLTGTSARSSIAAPSSKETSIKMVDSSCNTTFPGTSTTSIAAPSSKSTATSSKSTATSSKSTATSSKSTATSSKSTATSSKSTAYVSTSTTYASTSTVSASTSTISTSISTAATNTTSTKSSKQKKVQETVSSESEEDLDTSSAFVSVIARKHRKHHDLELKGDHFSGSSLPKEDHHSVVLRSRQLALRGNEMANLGHFSEAAELFTEAIKLDPSDHRFYGNRSYCFDRLNLFEKALKDADKAIALSPVWPKGYFRRGRALLGLKKYADAEQCFVEVMKRDNDCVDAITELRKAKILQIMEKGYSKDNAEAAISNYSTVAEALGSLQINRMPRVSVKDDVDIFVSDDDSDISWKCIQKPKPSLQPYDIKMDPNNPEGHNSLWIGNVQSDVTERKLSIMFGKYGELVNVKLMPEKFCAFVNYKLKSSPGKAMKAYQNYELSGAKLVIRFPNLPGETPVKKKPAAASQEKKLMGPVNGNECYFWRTTGCVHGDQCRYQHVKEHKGIDKKSWHVV